MQIYVNDEAAEVTGGQTLADLLAERAAGQRWAVAVNETVVRQDEWAGYALQENDRVLLIAPVQGG